MSIPKDRKPVENSLTVAITFFAELCRAHTDKDGADRQFDTITTTSKNFTARIPTDDDEEACEILAKKIKESFKDWKTINDFKTNADLIEFIQGERPEEEEVSVDKDE